jgi:hypothetical protein
VAVYEFQTKIALMLDRKLKWPDALLLDTTANKNIKKLNKPKMS